MYIKDARITLLPGLCGLDLSTSSAGTAKTYLVELAMHTANPPHALIADLAAIGFVPELHPASSYRCPESGIEVQDIRYLKPGTGLFQGWTAEEERANLAALQKLFARHGLECRPRRRSFAEDL